MAIGHVELNRAMTGVQDLVTKRHNEEAKPMVDQSNIMDKFQKNLEQKLTVVQEGDNVDNRQKKFDAKEKGNGEYSGDGGKKKTKNKNEKENKDGIVRPIYNQSFDLKI